ncbi:MAG TPA: hypothetical protein PK878_01260 [bacterium]|nr:hypothetical protein [Candidatus Omnitrophota bacterium]HOJ58890.1 hypothetical protein [bacterium]HOL93537.1 hypothetical protein [bacterium]
MLKKRFLRDKVLDEMIAEIRRISEKAPDNHNLTPGLSQSMLSISELYETHKTALHRLESIIEDLRQNPEENRDLIAEVVAAAANVQRGLVALHNAFTQDIRTILDGIQKLRETLGLSDDGKPEI